MSRTLQHLILGADLLWILACVAMTRSLQGTPSPHGTLLSVVTDPIAIIALLAWTFLYYRKGLVGFSQVWDLSGTCAQVIVGALYLLASTVTAILVLGLDRRGQDLILTTGLLVAGLMFTRWLAYRLIDLRRHARTMQRVMIVGSGRMARELQVKIERHPELCMQVVGTLSPSDTERTEDRCRLGSEITSLRTLNIPELLERENIHEIIVVQPMPPGSESEQLLAGCREAGLRVHVVPQQYEPYLSKARLTEIEDVPLLSLEEQTLPAIGVQFKNVIDALLAACLLVLVSPLFLLMTLFLRCRNKQPFRGELRCGKNGSVFLMYRLNVDREDDELSAFERFLVQFSLTEIPQLLNVLKGEMSLVGPRPEAPERVKHYSVWQRQRLTVKPGLTGLAQANGFREQHSSEEKIHFDLQYILHWSLFLDLCLILQTGWTLLRRLVHEHGTFMPPLLKPISNVRVDIGRMCNADSAQSGAD